MRDPRPQVVELTAKKWKALRVFGTTSVLVSTIGFGFIDTPFGVWWLVGFLLTGLALRGYAALRAWWHHG